MTAEDLRGGMPIDTLRNVSYVEAIGCSTIRNLTFYVQLKMFLFLSISVRQLWVLVLVRVLSYMVQNPYSFTAGKQDRYVPEKLYTK